MYDAISGYELTLADRAGAMAGNAVKRTLRFLARHWRGIATYQAVCFIMFLGYLYFVEGQIETPDKADLLKRSWGGFDERPMTEKCYRQERTAMLLNMFLGIFAADQFYARHWALASFKLITLGGLGAWALVDMILWIVGGVYGTPGCPGGREWQY